MKKLITLFFLLSCFNAAAEKTKTTPKEASAGWMLNEGYSTVIPIVVVFLATKTRFQLPLVAAYTIYAGAKVCLTDYRRTGELGLVCEQVNALGSAVGLVVIGVRLYQMVDF